MRNLVILSAVTLAAFLSVAPLQACEKCDQYFSYQSLTWCDYCAASYCGYFSCRIQYFPGLGQEYCTGDDGCFEVGHGCKQERVLQETRLENRWRLTRVQLIPPQRSRTPTILLRTAALERG